jgi:hypothetical protein
MFVGHAALALMGKSKTPTLSLGVLFAAAFGLDLLWPVLLMTGLETVRIDPGNTAFTPLAFDSYPWSHSLLMVLLWSALAAGLVVWRSRGAAAGLIVGLLVLSHWALDAITHRPDLPLWPGASPLVGLGLWNAVPASVVVEGALFGCGILLYVRGRRPVDRTGRLAFWSLIGLMTVIWASQPFTPPPPSATAVAVGAMATWLLPFWAAWADRHRAAGVGIGN